MKTTSKSLQTIGTLTILILCCSVVVVAQTSSGVSPVCCAGTPGAIPMYKTSSSIDNSNIFQSTSGSTNGYIGMGTSTPAANLHIVGQANTGLILESSVPNGNPTLQVVANTPAGAAQVVISRADGGAPALIGFNTAGANEWTVAIPVGGTEELDFRNSPSNIALALLQSGQVGIGTNTPSNLLTLVQGGGPALADGWNTYSALRFKTNIQPLLGSLERVEQLRGVSYQRKVDGRPEIGVIAEEVDKIVPEIVSHDPKTLAAQGVDYSRLSALLIEAIKSQQAQIEELKAEVSKLSTHQ
jgi:hypothetical protein